jgi:1-acylglycerol-3-phosphate O-acyltransferase
MEKFSQFRDKGKLNIAPLDTHTDCSGTAIAPFLPIPTDPAGLYLPFHIFLFIVRVPLLLTLTLGYFFIFQWLPIGNLGRRAALWSMMGVPGIWWIDLQVDGVRRGYGYRGKKHVRTHCSLAIGLLLRIILDCHVLVQ